jgi:flagellar basal-body rod modification protein FlgD
LDAKYMTTITETNPATTGAGTRPPTADKAEDKTATASATAAADFKNFLTLLTAQLRHQDPLSPLDSTQFVEQLASFSAVEQQIETNKLLKELMGASTKSDFENAALWIGKEVDAAISSARFEGKALEFGVPVGPEGAAGEIVVRDAAGAVVYREKVAAGQSTFKWNGVDEDGAAVSNGVYKFIVEYVKDEATAGTKLLSSSSRVTEVRFADGKPQLGLENGAVVEPDDVVAMREPASDVLPGDV